MTTKLTAATLRSMLQEAEQEERAAEETRRQTLCKRWKELTTPRSAWEWTVTEQKQNIDIGMSNSNMRDGLYISTRVKPEIVQAWQMEYGALPPDYNSETRYGGMFYYRTDENILTHAHGGYHVLTSEPKLCSDEEWEQMKLGNIPQKFKGKWRGGQ